MDVRQPMNRPTLAVRIRRAATDALADPKRPARCERQGVSQEQ